MTEKRPPAPKYVASTPDSEILGMACMALEQSSELEEFVDLLEKHGFRGIEADKWYSTPKLLDYYREVMQRPNASANFVSMGINIYKTAALPEGIQTIEQGLQLMNQIGIMNMRNDPDADSWYTFETVEDRYIRFSERTPFPHDLVYGFIYGIARRLAPPGARPIVKRTFLNEADPDADGAIYDITW